MQEVVELEIRVTVVGEMQPGASAEERVGFVEEKCVNVRRLVLFGEHSVDLGPQWAVFEPNGDPLYYG